MQQLNFTPSNSRLALELFNSLLPRQQLLSVVEGLRVLLLTCSVEFFIPSATN
jgi:hypothetical protein